MIRQEIKEAVCEAVRSLAKDKSISIEGFSLTSGAAAVEFSKDRDHGDYASNIAMQIAQATKKNPKDLADLIKARIEDGPSKKLFEKIEVAGPGFINFRVSKNYFQKEVSRILKEKDKFGAINIGKNLKTQVEFISSNPSGQMHVGNGRGAFYGDVLARILTKAGYKTDKEFYINDAKVSKQIQELGKTALGHGESYLTPYLKETIEKLKPGLSKMVSETEAGYYLSQAVLKDLKKFVEKKLDIKFDYWISEEDLYKQSWVISTYDILKKQKLVFEKDDAYWLKLSDAGQKDEVLLRKNGSPTYFLSDIAYHRYKIERGYKKIIDIWGADHQGHIPRMNAVMKILGYKGEYEVLISQIVRLKGGKMSKREGNIITLESLVDEVGLDAARFFYLVKSLNAQMEFDVELAKEKSEKSPVFYVQYAYARISSILAKSKAVKPAASSATGLLVFSSEIELIKELLRLQEVVEDTAADYQVQRLFQYSQDLATSFHKFYCDCRVITEDKKLTAARLQLVMATKIVLKNTFDLMGISAPEKM
ncbi:MAG TPA: arginine--tRNA ligase [Candidatus Paceibacterota bacterium]|nr:arginine--tRNA ligase [Candidatus Pacearchaeota archaeon]HRZ51350.1 arginine--tRNA ligase [Candidatus Paceibacterota bacterium]HSA37072.1 arginine--tRNA ligase [Candidatus Paceibacterota bacterium]